ncbi:MAG: TonB-dependent receptor, partial [Muribaculaceae bacterium]|nr:TonB-dependent receptor [Muribaculaceae bacterium]
MNLRTLIITLSLIILLLPKVYASDGVSSLSGKVLGSEDKSPLIGCLVKIHGLERQTVTNENGDYSFNGLPCGDYTVEASYMGYIPQKLNIKIDKNEGGILNFELKPDAFMLEQVVVTSSKTETKRRESPSLVNVISGKTFLNVGACSLADGLDFQPGVRVENDCQNCGFTQVRINGLDGHYSQILMNSRPIFSALAGVYGLEHIPANMIDRVEVMRGGGSALFGSSAIGGTINIITKDPLENSAQVSHTLTSMGISGALDNNTTFNASIVSNNSKAGLFLYGQSRYRDGYDHDNDGFTEVAQLKSQTIGMRSFLRTSDDTKLTVEYHNTREYRRGGDQLDQPPHLAMVAEQVDHDINAGEATYDWWLRDRKDHLSFFAALQNTARKSYYGSNMDPDAYGRTNDIVVTAGTQWTHQISRFWFMPAELVAGLEYSFNRLHDVTIGYGHDILQKVNIYSGYLQNEWKNDTWGFLVGARLDKHTLIHNPIVSPRANIRYNPRRDVNFRLSYSTGFRSPQAYDEDFHVAIVGGERVVTVLAPNLKQESSQSFSLSADLYPTFGSVQTNFLIEGFFTDLRDVFALRQLDGLDENGNAVLERYNGSGARVMGINLEAKAFFSSHFDVQGGVTFQQSRYKKPEYWSDDPDVAPVKKMFRTPDIYGYFTANWEITHSLKATLNGTATGPMLVQHLVG